MLPVITMSGPMTENMPRFDAPLLCAGGAGGIAGRSSRERLLLNMITPHFPGN
jgi:hypothetical protein